MTDNKCNDDGVPCVNCKFKDECDIRKMVELKHDMGSVVICAIKHSKQD